MPDEQQRRGPDDFPHTVHDTAQRSTPWWPERRAAPGPNVVVVLLDDVGFAQLGCYGSSISTPHMDALAESGLRFSNFHATALCSPTRASLLTGRNHHSVGMGFLAAFDTGYPSYRGRVTRRAATVAELMRDSGYGTYALGKWHLAPPSQLTAAGPFNHWPTQRGFDRYYGFLGGEDDQRTPELWYDQHRVEVPADPDYHLSEDLVDRATEFVSDHRSARPDDPFLLYLSFGACHAPHQAPREFIDAYKNAFDDGWDEERERVLDRQVDLGLVPRGTRLTPRNPGVSPWAELPPERQSLYARMQEVFAGFMTHTDAQVGRLVEFLRRYELLDDTVIVLMSDNGASAEGGEHGTANEYRWFLGLPDPVEELLAVQDELGSRTTHGHYPTGWAQAGNTPSKYYKRFADGGGIRVPLIVHWPHGTGGSGIRRQFHHVIDIAPTLLEICGVPVPSSYRGVEQMPVHGVSMAYAFDGEDEPSRRPVQYFETAGHRGIVAEGWKAVARHQPGTDFDQDRWELYDLTQDFSESRDLADVEPERAARLRDLWWEEARRFQVLPLDDRMQDRMAAQDPARDQLHYALLPGARLLNGVTGPSFAERGFSLSAEIEPWCAGHEGVLLAWGHRATGFSLHLHGGRLRFDLNLGGRFQELVSPPVGPGTTRLGLRLRPSRGGAVASLRIGDDVVAEAALPSMIPAGMGLLPTQCGYNSPSPVTPLYSSPHRYAGGLVRVLVDLSPRDRDVDEAELQAELRRQ